MCVVVWWSCLAKRVKLLLPITRKVSLAIFLVEFMVSCGVPDFTSANLNNLNRPQLEVFNTADSVLISITGFYPPSQYPDFIGYNVYLGDNNDSGKVVKRILYHTFRDDLPTVNASPVNLNSTTSFSISKFTFRFTDATTESDLLVAGATNNGQLYERDFKVYEKYYFIAEAVERTGRKGISTEPVSVVFLNYQTNQSITYGGAGLVNVGAFNGLKANVVSFNFPDTDGYTYSMYSVGSWRGLFGSIPKGSGYRETDLFKFKPYDGHTYYLKAQSTVSKDIIEYLALNITATNASGFTFGYGHEKDVVTDINKDISLVN